MTSASALSTVFGPMRVYAWVPRSRASALLDNRRWSDRCVRRRLRRACSASCGRSSSIYSCPLLPPPPFLQGFLSFRQSRTLFLSTFFSLPSFLHTGCWSRHPLEQRSSLLISAALSSFFPYRFLTTSRHGEPHLARVLPSCRYHCERL